MNTIPIPVLFLLHLPLSNSLYDNNLIRRIKLQVTAKLSTQWLSWSAEKAIDFIEHTEPNKCDCCAGAHHSPSWWSLDLGNTYPIKTIIFIGRSDDHDYQATGFKIYNMLNNTSELIYENTARTGNRFTIELNSTVVLRKIKITDKHPISICELKLIESDTCPAGSYGHHCEKRCHCNATLPCNRITGVCQSGGCEPGWSGSACDTDLNLISRIQSEITVTMSRPYRDQNFEWAAKLAVDLVDNYRPNICKCCSATFQQLSYWRLDLGNVYPIQTIVLIGRKDGHGLQSDYFWMYGNSTAIGRNGELIWRNKAREGFFFTKIFDDAILLRTLEIRSSNGLAICELKLIEGDCPVGRFDTHCSSFCHCYDGFPCNKTDGTCQTPLCRPGWSGSTCNAECLDGLFGQNCSSECHCLNSVSCHHINGECPNGVCAPGWKGFNCSTECDKGFFGQNCAAVCRCLDNEVCDPFVGVCPSRVCAPGWRGDNCSLECPDGLFGQNCSYECHCLNNVSCHHTNGGCPNGVCAQGWKGFNCSKECDEGFFGQNCSAVCRCLDKKVCDPFVGFCPSSLCAPGWQGNNCSLECSGNTYGSGCSSVCHCANSSECHHINGSCPFGLCESGWRGDSCSIRDIMDLFDDSEGKGKDSRSDVAYIGAGVGVLVVLVIVSVIIICKTRRRESKNKEKLTSDKEKNRSDKASSSKQETTTTGNIRQRCNIAHKETVKARDENMYYAYDDSDKKIRTCDLWDYIHLAYTDKCEKLHEEFQKLPQGLIHDAHEARRPENSKKSRYKELYAYDRSRVILSRDDPGTSTYINACFIDGYQTEKKFIASQGPTVDMVGDFWNMVIQESVSMIVMLTNVIEHRVRKCIQYWPIGEEEEETFGDVTVSTVKITTLPDYVIRELELTKENVNPKRITQYHFTAWPDKDVPDAACHLVNFWRKVDSLAGTVNGPIVVHCSAGVGRTGTFIALDNLYRQARKEGFIQPFTIVSRMRQQRVNMVQTKAQYVFLHEAVAEALYLRVTPVRANEYEACYKSLLQYDRDTGNTGLEQQFQLIEERQNSHNANEYCNFATTKESEEYRPKASSVREDTLDISYVQNYAAKEVYIITKSLGAAKERIWRLIEEKNIKTWISFDENGSNKKAGSPLETYKMENKVQMLQSKLEKHILVKTYASKQSGSTGAVGTLKQFEFLSWRHKAATPPSVESIIALVKAVQQWQPSVDESQPILIHCKTGYEKAGLVCLLHSVFDRLKEKEDLNILKSVKHMKERNPRLITEYAQYEFCHSAVLEYIRESDVYMNV